MRISRTRRTQPSRLGTLRVGAIFFGAWAATAIGSHALAQDASRLKPLPLTIKQVPVSVGHPHANPGAPAPRGSCPENVRLVLAALETCLREHGAVKSTGEAVAAAEAVYQSAGG